MPRSLRLRLALVVGMAAVPPLLALGFFWSRDLQDRARAELEREQAKLAEVVGDGVMVAARGVQAPAAEDGVRRVYGDRQVAGPAWFLAIGAPASLA